MANFTLAALVEKYRQEPEFYFEEMALEINESICMALQRSRLTEAEFLAKVGMSRRTWKRRLNDGRYSLKTLIRIAHVLGRRLRVVLPPR